MKTIDQLHSELAALPEPPFDPRVVRYNLEARITAARNAEADLAEIDPQLVDLTKWRGQLVDWRQRLCDDLLALPPRDRREFGLKLSIMQIDRGLDFRHEAFPARIPLDDLMAAAGYRPDGRTLADSCGACWRGSMPVVEERLRDLQRRRDEARVRLDSVLRET